MKKLLLTVMFMTSLFSDDSVVQPIPTEKIQHTTLFGPIKDIDVSTDGKFVVMGSLGGNIFIQDLEDKNTIAVLRTTLDDITSLDLSKDMTTIIAGDIKGQIEVWSLPKRTLVRKLDGHTKQISSVSISDDNTRAMSGSSHETIKLWNLQTGDLIITTISWGERADGSYPDQFYTAIVKNHAIAYIANQRVMEIYDVKNGEKIGKVTVFDENVDPEFQYIPTTPGFMQDDSTAFSEDGNTLFVSTMDEESLNKDCLDRNRSCSRIGYCIKAIDVKSNKVKFKIPIKGRVAVLTLSKDGKHGLFIEHFTDKIKIVLPKESTLLSGVRYKEISLLKRFEIDSGKVEIDVLYKSDESTIGFPRERAPRLFKIHEISNGKFIGLEGNGEVNMWDINR